MQIKYIEGFAGIGGFRLGFEQACAELNIKPKCIFAFEKDKFARQTYFANFGEEPAGDITKIPSKDILGRKHKDDIAFFFAGFPCQPWSTAGKQKGVDDERDMIPQVVRIIKDKKPDVFILENVKGLKSKKFKDIYDRLMWDLKVICNYTVYERIYNANAVVPQNRKRIFIVGFKNQTDFEFPELPPIYPVLKDFLEFENVPEKYFLGDKTFEALKKQQENRNNGFRFNICNFEGASHTIPAYYGNDGSECLIPKMSKWTPYHRVACLDEQANTITAQYGSNGGVATLIPELKQIGKIGKGGQAQRVYDINGLASTQSALGGGQGAKTGLYAVPELKKIGFVDYDKQGQKIWDINGIAQTQTALSGNFGGKTGLYAVPKIEIINGIKYIVDYSRVRKLMPRECARVMGFQDDFKIVVSDSQAYKQFGNAVVPAVVKEICKAVIKKIIFSKLGG